MPKTPRSPRLFNLLTKGRLLRFKKNQVISSTSDKDVVMLVVKGYVKRYFITESGSLGVQIVYGPQDIFSLTKVFNMLGQSIYDGPEVYYYETMSDAQVYALDIGKFDDAAEQDPLLYKDLFLEAGYHLKTCVHSIENISLGSTYSRVAHELLFNAKEFGEDTKDGVRMALPLTHQDLADILGTTRETVSKAIIKLRQEGVIEDIRNFTNEHLKRLEEVA